MRENPGAVLSPGSHDQAPECQKPSPHFQSWMFHDLRKEISGMCDWWRKNLGSTFSVTEKTLARLGN
jgi:hypothetical protein